MQPISVGRIRDRDGLLPGQGRKFAVARIEARVYDCLRNVSILAARTPRQGVPFNAPWSTLQYGEIESVADARLIARVQVPVILGLHLYFRVEQDPTIQKNALEKVDRVAHGLDGRLPRSL